MKTNYSMIERLEGRQLMSVAPVAPMHRVGSAKPIVGDNVALTFNGTAVNGAGMVMANLKMTVQKTAAGFSDQVIVTDKGGGVTDLTISMNAAGHFSYKGTDGGLLTLTGQMNAADTIITGTWIHAGTDGTTHGTLNLTAPVPVIPVKPTPTKPATPTKPTTPSTSVANYVGTAVDQKNETSHISLVVTDTKDVRTAMLNINNNSGGTTPITFTITSSLTFTFSFTQPNEMDTVTGKMSADGKTITGHWISVHADGTTGGGTFTATRT